MIEVGDMITFDLNTDRSMGRVEKVNWKTVRVKLSTGKVIVRDIRKHNVVMYTEYQDGYQDGYQGDLNEL